MQNNFCQFFDIFNVRLPAHSGKEKPRTVLVRLHEISFFLEHS